MGENVKRINVTLPVNQVERIQELVAAHPEVYPSVSAFVTDAVAARLSDDDAHGRLVDVLRELGGEPDDDARAWAADALRMADEVARSDTPRATDAA